jgi:hypothetical protein
MDNFIFDFPELKEKVLSNKIGISVGTIRMEKALVLQKYGMEVTCHRDSISIGKLIY